MKTVSFSRKASSFVIGVALLFVMAFVLVQPAVLARPDDGQAVRQAWERLRQAGRYEFSSQVQQSTLPGPRVSNAGLAADLESYYVSGAANLAEPSLQVRLYQNQGSLLNSSDGLEIRIQDGKASGRLAGQEWEELDDFSADSFAPGGDAASFLAAATGIQRIRAAAGPAAPAELPEASAYTRYRFTIDSDRYAGLMRDQLMRELQRAGKLPFGMSLDMADAYRRMEGSGEIWISADGLPLRLALSMTFPPDAKGDQVKADIKTDFFNIDREGLLAASPWPVRLAGLLGLTTDPQALLELSRQFIVGALIGLAVIFLALSANRRWVRTAVSLAVIILMVITPLWNGAQAASFYQEINSRQQRQNQQSQENQQQDAVLRDLTTSAWDPQLSPEQQTGLILDASAMPAGGNPAPAIRTSLPAAAAAASASGSPEADITDSDQDGLSDAYERDSNYFNDKNQEVVILNPLAADTDGDTLSDGEEVKLGLKPAQPDSDFDGILDRHEVQGFVFGNATYYTNPSDRDTDKDGQLDGSECSGRVITRENPNLQACTDTDGDGLPDVFDTDDDNDGVPTRVDVSPYILLDSTYDQGSPFNVQLANAGAGRPVSFSYQVRPSNPAHLTYSMNVLDWPASDTEGQVQRVFTTTYASQMSALQAAQDPRLNYGDMRLVPMLEVRLPGTDLPLPLTNSFAISLTNTNPASPYEAEFRFTGQAGSVNVSMTRGPAAAGALYHAVGVCSSYSQPSLIGSFSGGSVTFNRSLGSLMEGSQLLFVSPGAPGTPSFKLLACREIPTIAHGKLPDQVVDDSTLNAYGGMARNGLDGSVLVYTPLNLVSNQAGGTPAAFQALLPLVGPGNAAAGIQQAVRMVWMLNVMTDTCRPQPADYTQEKYGKWCDPAKPEQWDTTNRVVHVYPDSFAVTGVSVKEELGVKMAVIFENPLDGADLDPLYDDPLWGMARGLEASFASGRAQGQQRDMTVDEIANRFDPQRNAGIPPADVRLWGFAKNSFQVERFDYATSDDASIQFAGKQALANIFTPYFDAPNTTPAREAATLLFAREQTERNVTLGETGASTCDASGCSFNLTGQQELVLATLNWAPYRKGAEGWQPYPITEYMDQLELRLRRAPDFQPQDASAAALDVVDGQIYVARYFYETLFRGVSVLVARNGTPISHTVTLLDDTVLNAELKGNVGSGKVVATAVKTLAKYVLDQTAADPILAQRVFGSMRGIGSQSNAVFTAIKRGVTDQLDSLAKTIGFKWTLTKKILAGVGGGLFAAGMLACLLISKLMPNTQAGKISKLVFDEVTTAISVVTTIKSLKDSIGVRADLLNVWCKDVTSAVSKASMKATVIGAAVAVVVTWAAFIATWVLSGAEAFSLAVNNMAADAVAMTITIVLLALLACDPTGIGGIIVGVIALIDLLVTSICTGLKADGTIATGDAIDKYVCIGITGWITKLIKWTIYGQTYMIDYDNSSRLSFDGLKQDLQNTNLGITTGNMMSITLGVTNRIALTKPWEIDPEDPLDFDWKALAYAWQYTPAEAKSAAFSYSLTTQPADLHGNLQRNSMPGAWKDVAGKSNVWDGRFKAATSGYAITLPEPGINRAPAVLLNEGALVPVQECIAVPVWIPPLPPILVPICWPRTDSRTTQSEIGTMLALDVLPPTLDEFYTLAQIEPGGYSLGWGRDQPLTFPIFKDADGDGLLSSYYSGNDPEDSDYDTDDDGLSDFHEVTNGLNPRLPDSDGDGLDDAEELRLGSSPTQKDSDGDGLIDGDEIAGWLFTYGFSTSGVPLETRVTSNHLAPDADGDGLTDLMEKIYGYNPNVPDNAPVLDYRMDLMEWDAPLVQLRFDEAAGAATFQDYSGFGFNAVCIATPCPQAGQPGQFGSAVRLSGNSALALPAAASTPAFDNNQPFSVATWLKWEGGDGTLVSRSITDGAKSWEFIWSIGYDGRMWLLVGPAVIGSQTPVAVGVWTHVAVTFSGSQVTFYVNGQQAGGGPWSNGPVTGTRGPLLAGAQLHSSGPPYYLNGTLDELNIFNRALNGDEVLVRTLLARYNLNDRYLRPGEQFEYAGTVENGLNSRFAHGLLSTQVNPRELLVDWASKLLPATFVLWPKNPAAAGVNTQVIRAALQVDPTIAATTSFSITQSAAAQIVDRRYESGFAELWLKFNEPAGATMLEDSSGSMPPRNVACPGCASGAPALGIDGMLNKSVRFPAGAGTPLALNNLSTLGMVDNSFTVAMWVKPGPGTQTFNLMNAAGGGTTRFALNLIPIANYYPGVDVYEPQVTINGADVTSSMMMLRNMPQDAWSHLVVRYDQAAQTLDLYINGAMANLGANPPVQPIAGDGLLRLGGSPQPVVTGVDDLRIFSRPLSSAEFNRLTQRPVLYLPMDGLTTTDASVYQHKVNTFAQAPDFSTTGVRQKAMAPRVPASSTGAFGALEVIGSKGLLDMSDGAFTFSLWVNPTGGNNSGVWEGIFGFDSGPNVTAIPLEDYDALHAYPSLQRLGRKLRFGYGNGVKWVDSGASADVLNLDQWNHVVVTLQPVRGSSGVTSYEYCLYVNAVKTNCSSFEKPPTNRSNLWIGRSAREWVAKLHSIYVSSIEDTGDSAEVYVWRTMNGGGGMCYWPTGGTCYSHFYNGTTTQLNTSQTFYAPTDTVTYEVWEDDVFPENEPDDFAGSVTYNWASMPKTTPDTTTLTWGVAGTLTSSISKPAVQFFGAIDEMEVYRYALDSEQVFDLYNTVAASAHLPLDDRPASDTFENRVRVGQIDDGVCVGSGCPAAGGVGLIDQAVRFDGGDDVIAVPITTTQNYLVSLWLNTFCQDCGLYTLETGAARLHQLYLKNGKVCSLAQGIELCSAATAADERWHHVAFMNVPVLGTYRPTLWVDGSAVTPGLLVGSFPSTTNARVLLGQAINAGQDGLNGQLDDVTVFRERQGSDIVARLLRRAPLLFAHLDEPDGSTLFTDATARAWTLGCSGATCPSAGQPGRLSTGVAFDGQDDLLTLQQSALLAPSDTLSNTFSVGVWAMPLSDPLSRYQTLWALSGSNGLMKYSLAIHPNGQKLCLVSGFAPSGCMLISKASLSQNAWNHAVLVVERKPSSLFFAEDKVQLYLNGSLDSEGLIPALASTPRGLGKLYLGRSGGLATFPASGAFIGRMDEVTLHASALNAQDVSDSFYYQASQVEEAESRSLTVDADIPGASLESFNPAFPYLAGGPRRLVARATDATTGVARLTLSSAHGSGAPVATQAPRCLDDLSGELFCPLFDPGGQDGLFTLSVQSMDGVGHLSEPPEYYEVFVDQTGPAFSGSDPGQVVSALRHPTQKNTWMLPIRFTVFDPLPADYTDPSGLDLESLLVTLYSEDGQAAGGQAQKPSYDGGTDTWYVDYLFPEKEPSGKLKVVIEAMDRVGNRGALAYEVLLDASPSRADLDPRNLPNGEPGQPTILDGGVLSGTVTDEPPAGLPYATQAGSQAAVGVQAVEVAFTQEANAPYLFDEPYPSGLLAWLPLDSAQVPTGANGQPTPGSTQRLFLDISPAQNAGTCQGAACPWSGQLGHRLGSIYFDGKQRQIDLGQKVNLANRSFSLAVWARRDQPGRSDPFLYQGPAAPTNQSLWVGINSQDRFVCSFGGSQLVSPDVYPGSDWTHWACTFDMTSGARTIYQNGAAVASDVVGALPAQSTSLLVGKAPQSSYQGHLDDLQFYGRALGEAELRQIYTGHHTVYQLDVKEAFYVDGDRLEDSSGFFHQAYLEALDPYNKVVNGRVGMFALGLDGDDRLVVPPSPSLSLDRGQLTLSAWVNRDVNAESGDIISQRDASPAFSYPSLVLTSAYALEFGFGDGTTWHSARGPQVAPGEWHFVAVTYNQGRVEFYLDGQPAGSASFPGAPVPYASTAFSVGQFLIGSLDDVRVYPRALKTNELDMLMKTAWQSAAIDSSGRRWTAPVPQGLEGSFQVDARGCDVSGNCDTNPGMQDQWGGIIDTLAPRIQVGTTAAVGAASTVTYTFSIEDLMLDASSVQTNMCVGPTRLQRQYYNNAWYLAQGIAPNTSLYRITGACSGPATPPDGGAVVYACDAAGNCTSDQPLQFALYLPLAVQVANRSQMAAAPEPASIPAVPAPAVPAAPPANGRPLEPALRFTGLDSAAPQISIASTTLGEADFLSPFFATLKGTVTDDYGVQKVDIRILKNGAVIYAGPASLIDDAWNAMWLFPDGRPGPGTYLLEVTATDEAGNAAAIQQEISLP